MPVSVPLPAAFLGAPIAHRGFHDKTAGRPENSRAAIRAAMAAGYGIEMDIQPSGDFVPMVFHDYDLRRLTGQAGRVRGHSAETLGRIALIGGPDGIPTLAEVLEIVGGKVPLLIEVKDQDGAMGPDVGPLEQAICDTVAQYAGPVALMSFNPHSVALLAKLAPDIPRGLVTSAFSADDWPLLPGNARDHLRGIPDYQRTGACFISHEAKDLGRPRVAELKAQGADVLCWTIRSTEAEAEARKIAQNITFENYPAVIPA
ncbi:MAG: glycerophosphodiester phosphodiesterase family protein [Albidovulum sp.]